MSARGAADTKPLNGAVPHAPADRRRANIRLAVILGLVAMLFYASMFFFLSR